MVIFWPPRSFFGRAGHYGYFGVKALEKPVRLISSHFKHHGKLPRHGHVGAKKKTYLGVLHDFVFLIESLCLFFLAGEGKCIGRGAFEAQGRPF